MSRRKLERTVLVNLTGKQSFLGFAELNKAVQLQFRYHHHLVIFIATQVNQAAVVLCNFGNEQLMTLGYY